jgi:hypothetical protein
LSAFFVPYEPGQLHVVVVPMQTSSVDLSSRRHPRAHDSTVVAPDAHFDRDMPSAEQRKGVVPVQVALDASPPASCGGGGGGAGVDDEGVGVGAPGGAGVSPMGAAATWDVDGSDPSDGEDEQAAIVAITAASETPAPNRMQSALHDACRLATLRTRTTLSREVAIASASRRDCVAPTSRST